MVREYDPIKGETPDKPVCETCANRLKILVAGKDIGPSNAYCKIYGRDNSDGKPIEILFKHSKCKFYKKEN